MSVFVHAQGMKTIHAGGSKNGKNSVHVVVEWPLTTDNGNNFGDLTGLFRLVNARKWIQLRDLKINDVSE